MSPPLPPRPKLPGIMWASQLGVPWVALFGRGYRNQDVEISCDYPIRNADQIALAKKHGIAVNILRQDQIRSIPCRSCGERRPFSHFFDQFSTDGVLPAPNYATDRDFFDCAVCATERDRAHLDAALTVRRTARLKVVLHARLRVLTLEAQVQELADEVRRLTLAGGRPEQLEATRRRYQLTRKRYIAALGPYLQYTSHDTLRRLGRTTAMNGRRCKRMTSASSYIYEQRRRYFITDLKARLVERGIIVDDEQSPWPVTSPNT